MNKDYIVEIEGNEELLERFIDSISADTVKESEEYPHPLQLPTGELFLVDSIVQYFLNKKPFIAENAIQFCDKSSKENWSEEDAREMPAYLWTYVIYSIWGLTTNTLH